MNVFHKNFSIGLVHWTFTRWIGILLVTISCGKYEDNRPQEDEASTEYFVKFNDGQSNVEFRNGRNSISARAISTNGFGNAWAESSVFSSNVNAGSGFQMSFSKLFYSIPAQLQLDSLFAMGRYTNFNQSSYSQVLVSVTYVDAKGVEWTTDVNSAQPASTVQIVSVEPVSAKGFRYKVKGRFNCRLYNGSVQNIILNNGEFTLKLGYALN